MTLYYRLRLTLTRWIAPMPPEAGADNFFLPDRPTDPLLPLPTLYARSPLFRHLAKRVPSLALADAVRTEGQVWQYYARALAILGTLYLLLWVVRWQQNGAGGVALERAVAEVSLGFLVVSVVLSMTLDWACVTIAARQFQRDSLHEITVLSRLSHRGIIVSHYAALHWRFWRRRAFVLVCRGLGVVPLMIALVIVPLTKSDIGGLNLPLLDRIVQVGIAASLSAVLLADAAFRLRGSVAVALALATTPDRSFPASLRALAILLREWGTQCLLGAVMLLFAVGAALPAINLARNWVPNVLLHGLIGVVGAVGFMVVIAYAVWFYYVQMAARHLRHAERRAVMGEL